MKNEFTVLIIEDDFYIADITKQFVSKIAGFSVVGTFRTGKEASDFLATCDKLPDLLFLDVFIPDVKGLELFWTIRKAYTEVDVIMMTAAKEVETIEETLRGGIFDYIVKPVDFSRIEKSLLRYKEQKKLLASKTKMEQEEIDKLTGLFSSRSDKDASQLPKGIDRLTLEKVQAIFHSKKVGLTAVEVGKHIGASRSTARRYLEYLTSIDELEAKLIYGEVGRPERRYFCEQNGQN